MTLHCAVKTDLVSSPPNKTLQSKMSENRKGKKWPIALMQLSIQIMFCGCLLALFSLKKILAYVVLLFSPQCYLIVSLLMMFDCFLAYVVSYHFTLNWSSLPSWLVADWKEQIWHLGQAWFPLNKQQIHTQKMKKGGNKQGQHKNWWHIEQTILTTSLISSHLKNKRTIKRTTITNRDNIRKE